MSASNRWWQEQERDNAAYFGEEPRARSRAFDEYAAEWARTLTKSVETNRSYRSQVRALVERFGSTPVAAISKADVKAMIADMVNRDGLGAGTVKVRMTALTAVMQSAIDDGLRGDDPTRKVDHTPAPFALFGAPFETRPTARGEDSIMTDGPDYERAPRDIVPHTRPSSRRTIARRTRHQRHVDHSRGDLGRRRHPARGNRTPIPDNTDRPL